MDTKQICELLVELEKNDVNQLEHDGFCLWPMLRFIITIKLLNFPTIKKQRDALNFYLIKKNLIKTYVNKIKIPFANLLKYKSIKVFSKQGLNHKNFQSEILYLSTGNTLTYLPQYGFYFDRIIDPFLYLTKKICPTSKLYLNDAGNPNFNGCYYPSSFIDFIDADPKHVSPPESIYHKLIELLDGYPLNPQTIYNKLLSDWPHFLMGLASAEKLSNDYKNLRFVGIVAWIQSPFHYGLIHGLRKNNIKILEIQHGIKGEYEPFYTHWTAIPKQGYLGMPNIFLNWSEYDYNCMKNSNTDSPAHKYVVAGFPWPDFYLKHFSSSIKSKVLIQANKQKATVLVTLQTITDDTPNLLPPVILEYLKSSLMDDCYIILRPHPGHPYFIPYLNKLLRGVSKKKYRISSNYESLFDLLLISTHHVTSNSTSALEASFFNVPTLSLGKDAKLYFKREIEKGTIMHSDGSLASFLDWLKTEHTVKGNDDIFISSLDYTKNVLRRELS